MTVGQETAILSIAPSMSLTGRITFTVRATALQDGKNLVMSEIPVTVEISQTGTFHRH